ncbi:membrane protein [Puia dinghuensis]|uniref:Membrane protein n=2 Tax=Puia dinghuensis TaxID=1792502 RepID=A0A8J2XVN8_9BACT|nr:membrane protein [Puia dinghuensis]
MTLIIIFLIPPIAQPLSFHRFADSRTLLGIPNFGNVVSNIPFLVIGIYGLIRVARASVPAAIRCINLLLFAGVVLTGLGSAYYHWHPNNDTLVWDRIPMTIVFMSFLSATVAELVSRPLGARLLAPLLAVGAGSVLWWHYTEMMGRGDLRLYFWVQFYPMLAILLLLWLYYTPSIKVILPSLIWIIFWYVIAKVFEQLDYPIYQAIGMSGHTLKHLAAAVSTGYFVILFRKKYSSKTYPSITLKG